MHCLMISALEYFLILNEQVTEEQAELCMSSEHESNATETLKGPDLKAFQDWVKLLLQFRTSNLLTELLSGTQTLGLNVI